MPSSRDVTDFLAAATAAVERMDADALEGELRRALLVLGVGAFTDDLLGPLLRDIGDRWERGLLTPAHEHIASAVVKRVIHWMTEPHRPVPDAPHAVVGTLAGEEHELGAMLAAAVAALEGWHVTFLGRDLPAADIALAARTLEARMVAVSTVDPSGRDRAHRELGRLLEALPAEIAVFVGGTPAGAVVDGLADARVHAVGSLRGFRDALRQLPVPA